MLARRALLAAGHAEVAEDEAESARDQHLLHHERGRGEVAPVGQALAARRRAQGARVGLRGQPERARSSPTIDAARHGRSSGSADDVAGDAGAGRSAHAPTSSTTCSRASRGASGAAARTRGFVKVQDGCDCHCAYCIIPTVRGDARSRPPSAVLERGSPPRRAGPARDGHDRDQRRRLPRPGARSRARRADGRGRARAGRRARAALERRGDPRQGLAAPGAGERAEGLPAPARPAAVRRRRRARARWAATTRPGEYLETVARASGRRART